jgi:hypothetical protein
MRADNRYAKDAAALGGDDLDMAFGFSFRLRAVILMLGPAQNADGAISAARFLLAQAG